MLAFYFLEEFSNIILHCQNENHIILTVKHGKCGLLIGLLRSTRPRLAKAWKRRRQDKWIQDIIGILEDTIFQSIKTKMYFPARHWPKTDTQQIWPKDKKRNVLQRLIKSRHKSDPLRTMIRLKSSSCQIPMPLYIDYIAVNRYIYAIFNFDIIIWVKIDSKQNWPWHLLDKVCTSCHHYQGYSTKHCRGFHPCSWLTACSLFVLHFQDEDNHVCYASLNVPSRANTAKPKTPTQNSDLSTYSEVRPHNYELWYFT